MARMSARIGRTVVGPRAIALGVVGALLAVGLSTAAEPKWQCPYRNVRDPSFPGLAIGTNYRDVKSRIPKAAKCEDRTREGCEFIDRYGYQNAFSSFGADANGVVDRFLYRKDATRGSGAWLPFGVQWSDSPQTISGKLRAAGVEPRDFRHPDKYGVIALGCFTRREYRIEFEFKPDGRLYDVVQAWDWP